MKNTLLTLVLVFSLLVLPMFINNASAQPPPPPPQDIPIDGGLFLLIAAGAAYGARKFYKQQKNTQE
jgi:peptidoglycan/LPS O-acetylase OafA/YrhL